jgi:hypothetical protein
MSQPDEQVQQFADELDKMVNRFRSEYDISYAAVVGALMFRIHTLMVEAQEKANEED